eukprot:6196642-Pleurochrysis_carterae.AAC.1
MSAATATAGRDCGFSTAQIAEEVAQCARAAYKREEYAVAARAFEQAAQLDPVKAALMHCNAAAAHGANGTHDLALIQAHYRRALALHALGRYADAIDACDYAIQTADTASAKQQLSTLAARCREALSAPQKDPTETRQQADFSSADSAQVGLTERTARMKITEMSGDEAEGASSSQPRTEHEHMSQAADAITANILTNTCTAGDPIVSSATRPPADTVDAVAAVAAAVPDAAAADAALDADYAAQRQRASALQRERESAEARLNHCRQTHANDCHARCKLHFSWPLLC